MRVYPERLRQGLRDGLHGSYVIHGDEQLLRDESANLIRQAAKASGVEERNVFDVDRAFDWSDVDVALENFSLFSTKKLVEVRFDGTPDKKAKERLEQYAHGLDSETTLLVMTHKLDNNAQKAKWFKTLDSLGINIPCWPVSYEKLPQWLLQRGRALSIRLSPEAVELLVQFVEGNLFAASQELEKLSLAFPGGQIGIEEVQAFVGNSAKFNVFILLDAALEGNNQRALSVLNGLRAEGIQSIAIIGLLARELRLLIACAFDLEQGQSVSEVLKPPRVWQSRKNLYSSMLKRHRRLTLQRMLRRCSDIDAIAKGNKSGDVWSEISVLLLMMTGIRVWPFNTQN